MTNKITQRIGKTASMLGLAGLLAAGPIAADTANAGSINTETRMESRNGTHAQLLKTRTKAIYGPFTLTYDINQKSDKPDEVRLWTDVVSKDKFSLGLLAQGETDSRKPYADIGACVGVKSGAQKYEAFFGPTVQNGVKPAVFYQLAIRNSDEKANRKANLVLSLVDDRAVKFGLKTLDFRPYVTLQEGNVFGGFGIRQNGIEAKTTRIYGSFGYKDDYVGTFTVFKHNNKTKEGKVKMQNALGHPNTGFYDISNSNLWNDLEVGMRDISTPYFSSPISKGDLTFGVEFNYSPKVHDWEAIIGKALGNVARVGAGVNYHRENRNGSMHGIYHVAKNVNILGVNAGADVRYNTRGKFVKAQVSLSRNFGGK